jgi:hypothetical protein
MVSYYLRLDWIVKIYEFLSVPFGMSLITLCPGGALLLGSPFGDGPSTLLSGCCWFPVPVGFWFVAAI